MGEAGAGAGWLKPRIQASAGLAGIQLLAPKTWMAGQPAMTEMTRKMLAQRREPR